jgi:hypothetical protein
VRFAVADGSDPRALTPDAGRLLVASASFPAPGPVTTSLADFGFSRRFRQRDGGIAIQTAFNSYSHAVARNAGSPSQGYSVRARAVFPAFPAAAGFTPAAFPVLSAGSSAPPTSRTKPGTSPANPGCRGGGSPVRWQRSRGGISQFMLPPALPCHVERMTLSSDRRPAHRVWASSQC